MKELQLNYALPDAQVDAWKGKAIDDTYYDPDLRITSDRVVMKPDGSGRSLYLRRTVCPSTTAAPPSRCCLKWRTTRSPMATVQPLPE